MSHHLHHVALTCQGKSPVHKSPVPPTSCYCWIILITSNCRCRIDRLLQAREVSIPANAYEYSTRSVHTTYNIQHTTNTSSNKINHNFPFLASAPIPCISLTSPQTFSAVGQAIAPNSLADALLACLSAYRAAMPCMITAPRNPAKARPHAKSGRTSYPDPATYRDIHSSNVGSPPSLSLCSSGLSVSGKDKDGLPRFRLDSAPSTPQVCGRKGAKRLTTSESGWPSVAISQSRTPMTRGRVLWKMRLSILKSPCTSVVLSFGWLYFLLLLLWLLLLLLAKKELSSSRCGSGPMGIPVSASFVRAW